ncbi:MFS transporter [Chloroflexota bacterium]
MWGEHRAISLRDIDVSDEILKRDVTETLNRTSGIKVAISLAGQVAFSMFSLSLGVLLPSIQVAFVIGKGEGGLLASVLLLTQAIAMVFGGRLVDRMGSTVMYALGIGIVSLGLLLAASSTNYWLLLGSVSMIGLGGGFFYPALYTYLGSMLASRGLMTGIANAAMGIGGFLGPLLAGRLVEPYSWNTPVYIFACIAMLVTILYLLVIKPRKERPIREDSPKLTNDWRTILRYRGVILIYLANFIANVGFFAFITWTPSFLLESRNLSFSAMGTLFGAVPLAGAVGAVVFGALSDALKNRTILTGITGIISAAISYLLFALPTGSPIIALMLIAIGFLYFPSWNLLTAIAQDSVSPENMGTATGLVQNAGLLGGVIGPVTAGYMIEKIGLPSAMLLVATVPMFMYGIIVILYKAVEKTAWQD